MISPLRLLAALAACACLAQPAMAQPAGQATDPALTPAPPAPTPVPASVPTSAPTPVPTPMLPSVAVPILMYHHVGNPSGGRYNIAQDSYEWQMVYLAQHGFTSVSIDQIAAALTGGPPLPPKPVAITFDDGWRRQLTNTLPALVRNSLRATYFIVYNQSARLSGFLNFDQLRQLRDAGMWIGSHTVSHPNLRKAPALRLAFELTASKQALEAVIEQPVTVFAYPGGSFDARVARAVQQAGYVAAVSVRGGAVQRADEVFGLRRIAIQGTMSRERFIKLVEGPFATPTPTPTPTSSTSTSTSTST